MFAKLARHISDDSSPNGAIAGRLANVKSISNSSSNYYGEPQSYNLFFNMETNSTLNQEWHLVAAPKLSQASADISSKSNQTSECGDKYRITTTM